MEGKNLKKSAYVEKLEMLRKKLSEYENIYAQSNGSSISRYNLNSANFESIESAIAKIDINGLIIKISNLNETNRSKRSSMAFGYGTPQAHSSSYLKTPKNLNTGRVRGSNSIFEI